MMETVFRVCLFISGVINFMPSLLAFWSNKISSSYGIDVPNSNDELLLRHRAVMLGIIGGVMIFSAISKKYYSLSVSIGLISMVSFIILYALVGNINSELQKVMQIDIAAILILLIGYGLYRFL